MAVVIANPVRADDQMVIDFQSSTGHPTIMTDTDPILNPDGYQAARDWVAQVMARRYLMPNHLKPGAAQYRAWRDDPSSRPDSTRDLMQQRVRWWQSYDGQKAEHTTDCVVA